MAISKGDTPSEVTMTLDEALQRKNVLRPGEKTAKELEKMADSAIDYTDSPELNEDFWKYAKLFRPAHKKMVSLRLDEEILEWFKAQGAGYQSSINAVLRAYVEAHKHHP